MSCRASTFISNSSQKDVDLRLYSLCASFITNQSFGYKLCISTEMFQNLFCCYLLPYTVTAWTKGKNMKRTLFPSMRVTKGFVSKPFLSWKESNWTSVTFSGRIIHWYPLSRQRQICIGLPSQAPSKRKAADAALKFTSTLWCTSQALPTEHEPNALQYH